MKQPLSVAAVAFSLLALAAPVTAHHSFSMEYDVKKPVKVTGTVVRLEWTNPHAHLYVQSVENGQKKEWNFEMASPNILERNGWTRKSVKADDTVIIEGFAGRVDESRGVANSITFSDGKALFAGAPER